MVKQNGREMGKKHKKQNFPSQQNPLSPMSHPLILVFILSPIEIPNPLLSSQQNLLSSFPLFCLPHIFAKSLALISALIPWSITVGNKQEEKQTEDQSNTEGIFQSLWD
jgi:hypothetical protein